MQMLILPMLAHAFQNGQTWEVIDAAAVKIIVDKLLDPPEEASDLFYMFLEFHINGYYLTNTFITSCWTWPSLYGNHVSFICVNRYLLTMMSP